MLRLPSVDFAHTLLGHARSARFAVLAASAAGLLASNAVAQAASVEYWVSFNGVAPMTPYPVIVDDNGPDDANGNPGEITFILPMDLHDPLTHMTLFAGLTIAGFKLTLPPGVIGRAINVTAVHGAVMPGVFQLPAGTIDIHACYRFNGPGLTVPAPNIHHRATVGSLENNVTGLIYLAGVRHISVRNGACMVDPGDPGGFALYGFADMPPPFTPSPRFFVETATFPISPFPCYDLTTVTRLTLGSNGDEVILPGSADSDVIAVLDCATGGSGGAIPAVGTGDGAFPATLPSAPMIGTLSASPPSGSTVLTGLRLNGLTHTYVGDLQVVLQDPIGNKYNVFCRPGNGGFSCDYGGDYTFVGQCNGGLGLPSSCAANFEPGTYEQSFGNWPSGTNSIYNTPLSSISATAGTWTLYVYDWAAVDIGALTSWDLCFGTPPPTSTGLATLLLPADSASLSSPANLTWSAASCATSYDVDVDGAISNVAGTSLSFAGAPGLHTWRVRGENGVTPGEWTAGRTFTFATPPPPPVCVTGGPGGNFPTNGSGDGNWPTILPTYPLNLPLSVTVPSGATKIASIKLHSLAHTYIGDTHLVLEAPTTQKYNVLHRPGFTGSGFGAGCDWNGDYAIYPSSGAPIDPSCPAATVPSGDYLQSFGSGAGMWPSGTNGINNTLLGSIPITSGVWVLHIYDWANGDIGSVASWDLCFDVSYSPVPYCTSGTSTNGCVPSISASASPSASFANPCTVAIANVEGQKFGIIFYGINNVGYVPVPWAVGSSSFLCVKGPTQRTGSTSSGGFVNQCNGSLVLDWNAFQSTYPTALGNPFSAGSKVYVQGWYRDPPAFKTTNLSNALDMTVQP